MEYIHKVHPRSRTIKIRVDEKGSVIVTTPPRTPNFAVQKFLHESEPWIMKHVELAKKNQHEKKEKVMYLGKQYYRIVSLTKHVGKTIEIVGNEMIVYPVTSSDASIARAIERWQKSQAEQYLIKKVHDLSKKMGLSFESISLRDQKSRWGSCSSAKRLQFNWRLIQAPPEVIEYVIIHELAQ